MRISEESEIAFSMQSANTQYAPRFASLTRRVFRVAWFQVFSAPMQSPHSGQFQAASVTFQYKNLLNFCPVLKGAKEKSIGELDK